MSWQSCRENGRGEAAKNGGRDEESHGGVRSGLMAAARGPACPTSGGLRANEFESRAMLQCPDRECRVGGVRSWCRCSESEGAALSGLHLSWRGDPGRGRRDLRWLTVAGPRWTGRMAELRGIDEMELLGEGQAAHGLRELLGLEADAAGARGEVR